MSDDKDFRTKPIPDDAKGGDLLHPCTLVETRKEAKAYFDKLVQWSMRVGNQTREEATRIQASNIGYFAGYYDQETRERILELFDTQHPIFGKRTPSAEEALRTGMEYAKKTRH